MAESDDASRNWHQERQPALFHVSESRPLSQAETYGEIPMEEEDLSYRLRPSMVVLATTKVYPFADHQPALDESISTSKNPRNGSSSLLLLLCFY